MNKTEQLTGLLAEYKNPIQLKNSIFNLLDSEFYESNSAEYIKFAKGLYKLAEYKQDWPAKQQILCDWLLLSNFEDPQSLNILKQTDIKLIFHLLSQNTNSDTKYQLFDNWYRLQHINDPLLSNSRTNIATWILQHITESTIDSVECIEHINSSHLGYNINKAQQLVTKIIDTIDVSTLSELDVLPLFKFYEFIYADTLDKLGTYYYKDKFQMIYNNAIALSVADSMDYWIQSLPSNTCNPIELPNL